MVGDDEVPASVPTVDLGGVTVQLAAGGNFTCALSSEGAVHCWGDGRAGKLGLLTSSVAQNVGDNESPASAGALDLGGTAELIATGDEHACAILTTGEVRCWGAGSSGRLGYGNTDTVGDFEAPASAGSVQLGGGAVHVSLGRAHSCAVLSDGVARCWGNNLMRQLGQAEGGSIGDNELPTAVPVLDLGQAVLRVAAGANHNCALLADGSVRCWGRNDAGQLGNATRNTNTILASAVPRVELGGDIVLLEAGNDHTCALSSTHELRCWGDGSSGKLGYGNTEAVGDDETPASAGTVSVF
jgi:alpha-tubulin suppressor-like RCC1 family protein